MSHLWPLETFGTQGIMAGIFAGQLGVPSGQRAALPIHQASLLLGLREQELPGHLQEGEAAAPLDRI